MTQPREVDVLIVGAGLSGIGVACHLVRERPGTTFALLERRADLGGTWDLFRYPGIRSDSDMLTFGYRFRPWVGSKVLADGPSIKQYLAETAAEHDVTRHVRFGHRVTRARWSSSTGRWTVEAVADGEPVVWTSRFLVGATGYYDYDQGHRPAFPGEDAFEGRLVHPQHWPDDLDHTGKRVVVIGSGATAVTLVPALARDAASVTMLQRSPSYVLPVPAEDPVASPLARLGAPKGLVYHSGRLRNLLLQQGLYKLCRANPALARKVLLSAVRAQVGPDFDMRHFTPSYDPWDERLCIVPNGDLFRVLRRGEASIVTDHVDTFTPDGIRTRSGQEIPADVVVVATGLRIQLFGGAVLEVDGEEVDTRERLLHKGVMMEGVPNAGFVIGYTNASWTLKADLASAYLCRLLGHMAEHGHEQVVPVAAPGDRLDVSVMGDTMRSGYIQRGDAVMPRQGRRGPWRVRNDYVRDSLALRRGRIDDKGLVFRRPGAAVPGAGGVVEDRAG